MKTINKKYGAGINTVLVICFIIVLTVFFGYFCSIRLAVSEINKKEAEKILIDSRLDAEEFLRGRLRMQQCAADMLGSYISSETYSADGLRDFLRSYYFTGAEKFSLYIADGADIFGTGNIHDRDLFYRVSAGESVTEFKDNTDIYIFVPVVVRGEFFGVLEGKYKIYEFFDAVRKNLPDCNAGIINSSSDVIAKINNISPSEAGSVLGAIGNISDEGKDYVRLDAASAFEAYLMPISGTDYYLYISIPEMEDFSDIYSQISKNTIIMMIIIIAIVIFLITYVKLDMTEALRNEKRINQELKLANDRIQLNEQRYNLAMEKSNSVFFEWNILTDSLEISENWEKALGIRAEKGNYLETILTNSAIYPEDRSAYYKFLNGAKEGSPEEECIIRMKFSDAEYYSWCRINITTVRNSVNIPIRVTGVIVDIDDEKREVDDLKRQQGEQQRLMQEKYAFIYRHSCDAILDINPDTGEYQCSFSNTNKIIKYIPESGDYDENMKKLFDTRVHHDDVDAVGKSIQLEHLKKYFDGGRNDMETRMRIIGDDGSISWLEYRAFYLNNAENPSIVAALRDITEQKQKRDMEQLDKQRLNAAVANIYSLVAIIDLSANLLRTIYYNPDVFVINPEMQGPGGTISYTEFVGVSANNSIYEDDRELYMSSCKLSNIIELHHNSGGVNIECRSLGSDNKYHWVNIIMIKINETMNDHEMMAVLVKNIDEKRQTEENLRDALGAAEDASRAKSEFLSRMSHEIRTPMNGIIGMTDIAMLSVGDDDKVRNCLDKIFTSSKFLLSLINDILDMSRIENGKITLDYAAFDLDDFIKNIQVIIGSQANSKGVNFNITEKDITHKIIIGDRLRINQIIINLLSNAIKFTAKGGYVDLIIEQQEMDDNKVFMHFSVKDTGVGMSKEFMTRIFKPFEQQSVKTTKTYGGTGLGLSISKNLVTMMGGHIQVSSVEGEGSTFDVELQLSLPETAEDVNIEEDLSSAGDSAEEFDFSGCKILLVEDDDLNQEIAIDVFERKGAEVESAYNGDEAVKMFAESSPDHYDVVFMDIMMPVKNGLDAAKEIRGLDREDAKKVPIIAMSANAFKEDIAKSLAAGMDSHISKPINPKTVYRTLKKYWEKK